MKKGSGIGKKRTLHTYENKVAKLERVYRSCPKIQAKYSFEEWISKIKKPTKVD